VRGPLVLMRVLDGSPGAAPPLTRRTLLSAEQESSGATHWRVDAEGGSITLRPFMDIGPENYRLYQDVLPGGR
jgi:hypothetical protein